MGGGNQNKWRGRRIRISITESELPSNSFLDQNFPLKLLLGIVCCCYQPWISSQGSCLFLPSAHTIYWSTKNTRACSEIHAELFVLFPSSSPLVLYQYRNQAICNAVNKHCAITQFSISSYPVQAQEKTRVSCRQGCTEHHSWARFFC